jgi:hypothetical protein
MRGETTNAKPPHRTAAVMKPGSAITPPPCPWGVCPRRPVVSSGGFAEERLHHGMTAHGRYAELCIAATMRSTQICVVARNDSPQSRQNPACETPEPPTTLRIVLSCPGAPFSPRCSNFEPACKDEPTSVRDCAHPGASKNLRANRIGRAPTMTSLLVSATSAAASVTPSLGGIQARVDSENYAESYRTKRLENQDPGDTLCIVE